jgi:hypothetical protein
LRSFFGTIQPTKMILLLLGEHGSGKTSALRRIQKFIFGSQADLLSVERDKQDGLIATITSDPIALFDNLDEQINWLPATLSRLATGVTFSRRRLYTTNEKVTFKSVSWLGITSRTVKFMEKQQDLPGRTLVLKLGRLVDRRAEDDLLESVARQRNALWSELLDELNAVVWDMNQNKDQAAISLRMADFAKLCLRVGRVWGRGSEVEKAIGKLEDAQSELTPENGPIATLLRLWLSQRRNRGRRMDAGDLFEVWGEFARDRGLDWPFDSSKSLAKGLSRMQAASQQEFEIEVRENKGTKQNEYSSWPKPVAKAQAEQSEETTADSESVPEKAA